MKLEAVITHWNFPSHALPEVRDSMDVQMELRTKDGAYGTLNLTFCSEILARRVVSATRKEVAPIQVEIDL